MVMNENTKWVATINQKYVATTAIGTQADSSVQIVVLHIRAISAEIAYKKAEDWLKASEIKDAAVGHININESIEIQEWEMISADKD